MAAAPYIDYKFLGIRSFVRTLEESGTDYRLFGDDLSSLYDTHEGLLNRDDDTVATGILLREGQRAFFAEFGVKITKSYRAYIVFIFDRHPRLEDLDCIITDLENIIQRNIDNVDITGMADSLSSRGKPLM